MSDRAQNPDSPEMPQITAARDLSQLSAIEVLGLHWTDLATACAVKLGLYAGTEADLAEARILIDSLAGLVDASARSMGSHHAAPMRQTLKQLQQEFRRASSFQDPPGEGPGERYTGYVAP